jgi:hypothetical protein
VCVCVCVCACAAERPLLLESRHYAPARLLHPLLPPGPPIGPTAQCPQDLCVRFRRAVPPPFKMHAFPRHSDTSTNNVIQMSFESSSFSAGGGVAAAVTRTSGNSTPSPAGCVLPPELPPLDDIRIAPAVAASAAALRARFTSVIDETKQWLHAFAEARGGQARAATDKEYGKYGKDLSWFISETLKQMQTMKDADAKLPDDDYVNDLKYKALVTRMLSSQEWAKQKLWLWLENQETNIETVGRTPLKSAHRQWLSFLKQRQHAVAVAGSVELKMAATKILQCKGLMVTDDASTEEADGEPLIYAAAADGWALDDLQFLIDAGASLAAVNQRGDSALHAAAGNGDVLAVHALVRAGADVKKLNKDGRTPLHWSAYYGHTEAAKLLVEYEADLAAVDRDGQEKYHSALGQLRGGIALMKTAPLQLWF